jgi:hypothetical protein
MTSLLLPAVDSPPTHGPIAQGLLDDVMGVLGVMSPSSIAKDREPLEEDNASQKSVYIGGSADESSCGESETSLSSHIVMVRPNLQNKKDFKSKSSEEIKSYYDEPKIQV